MNLQHPDTESGSLLPEWLEKLIDERILSIYKNPDKILPINGLIEELDNHDL